MKKVCMIVHVHVVLCLNKEIRGKWASVRATCSIFHCLLIGPFGKCDLFVAWSLLVLVCLITIGSHLLYVRPSLPSIRLCCWSQMKHFLGYLGHFAWMQRPLTGPDFPVTIWQFSPLSLSTNKGLCRWLMIFVWQFGASCCCLCIHHVVPATSWAVRWHDMTVKGREGRGRVRPHC